jgi:hypothetical protein
VREWCYRYRSLRHIVILPFVTVDNRLFNVKMNRSSTLSDDRATCCFVARAMYYAIGMNLMYHPYCRENEIDVKRIYPVFRESRQTRHDLYVPLELYRLRSRTRFRRLREYNTYTNRTQPHATYKYADSDVVPTDLFRITDTFHISASRRQRVAVLPRRFPFQSTSQLQIT